MAVYGFYGCSVVLLTLYSSHKCHRSKSTNSCRTVGSNMESLLESNFLFVFGMQFPPLLRSYQSAILYEMILRHADIMTKNFNQTKILVQRMLAGIDLAPYLEFIVIRIKRF